MASMLCRLSCQSQYFSSIQAKFAINGYYIYQLPPEEAFFVERTYAFILLPYQLRERTTVVNLLPEK